MISWDCFDTLISRKCIYTNNLYEQISKKIGDPSFVHRRIEAGYKTETYEEIYKKLPYDPKIELDLELENCYPIVSNINEVQNNDLIVSDMYLPKDHIYLMLEKCGLSKSIHLIVSYEGKKNGTIWKNIDIRLIKYHIGDNQHSDYIVPTKLGIQAYHYKNSQLTEHEQLIYTYDQNLAGFMRYMRLNSPYSNLLTSSYYDKNKYLLWHDQSDYNLPILILGIKELDTILNCIPTFNFRDCLYLKPLYDKVTNTHSKIIHSSRYSLQHINNSKYIESIIKAFQTSPVIDLNGSGVSFTKFLSNYNIDKYTLINFIGGPTHQIESPNIITIFDSHKNNMLGLNFEKHNLTPIGTVIDYKDDIVRAECEFNSEAVRLQNQVMLFAINNISSFLPISANKNLAYQILSKLSQNYTSQTIPYI